MREGRGSSSKRNGTSLDRASNLSLSLSARFLFTKDDTDIDFELIFNEGTIMYVICFLINFLEIYINREIKGEGKGSILLRR